MDPPPRIVTLVLVRADGESVGVLPPFPVATPWWQDAEPVVQAAQDRHGLRVTLLRLLTTALPDPQGGAVTYLAEVDAPVDAAPWNGTLDDHPLRMRWARAGGPGRDLAWADAMLAAHALRRIAPAQQVRTWNLSSLWRLPVEGDVVWLKAVPAFFAHEGAILERLQGHPVPRLLAHDDGRMLLREAPGEDLYGAPRSRLLEMVTLLVDLQREFASHVSEIRALGLPDWRGGALCSAIADVVARTAVELEPEERRSLADLVEDLDRRFDAITACGQPETLVHGDFHPGNFRGGERSLVLLDWGDSGVGHPLLDEPAFLDRIAEAHIPAVREHWHREWRRAAPDAEPERASELLRPIAAARMAVVYRKFLDAIEPSEHAYHRADPAVWLRRAAATCRRQRTR